MLTLRLCLGASVSVLVLVLEATVLVLVLRVVVLLTTLTELYIQLYSSSYNDSKKQKINTLVNKKYKYISKCKCTTIITRIYTKDYRTHGIWQQSSWYVSEPKCSVSQTENAYDNNPLYPYYLF